MKILKIDYWLKNLKKYQLKKDKRTMIKKAREIKNQVFENAQNRFKIDTNAVYLSQIKYSLNQFVKFLDYSEIITKGSIKENNKKTFYGLNKKVRFQIKIKEIKNEKRRFRNNRW